jgi:hypothetical protein
MGERGKRRRGEGEKGRRGEKKVPRMDKSCNQFNDLYGYAQSVCPVKNI